MNAATAPRWLTWVGVVFLLWDLMPQNLIKVEFGEYNYYRALFAGSLPLSADANTGVQQGLTYALEYNYYDGPWQQPEEFNRWNGLMRWFKTDDDTKLSITLCDDLQPHGTAAALPHHRPGVLALYAEIRIRLCTIDDTVFQCVRVRRKNEERQPEIAQRQCQHGDGISTKVDLLKERHRPELARPSFSSLIVTRTSRKSAGRATPESPGISGRIDGDRISHPDRVTL